MPTTPVTYTEAEAGITAAAGELVAVMDSIRAAIARIQAGDAKLTTMLQAAPTGWASHVTYISQQAAAAPTDQAWQDLKRRTDKLAGDFGAVQGYVQGLITAINEA